AGVAALQFKGQVLMQLGRPEEAATAYRQALKVDPEARETLEALIQLELAANNRSQALDYLRRYTVVEGSNVKELVKAAQWHLRLERYEDAFELAMRARAKDFHADGQRVLGLVYLHRGDFEKAAFHLTRADLDAQVLEGLIRAYVALGKLAEAERQAERVQAIAQPTGTLRQACTLVKALAQRRSAVRKQPQVPADQTSLWETAIGRIVCAERALADGLPAAQVEALIAGAFADGVEIGPAYALRGLLALEKGRLTKALADAERAVALSRQEARAYYVRGRVRLERGAEGALTDLRRAAELSQLNDASILHWLASALVRTGRTAEALAAQQLAVKLRPNDPEMQDQLRQLEQAGQPSKPGGM